MRIFTHRPTSLMTSSKLPIICLATAALLLFFYTFVLRKPEKKIYRPCYPPSSFSSPSNSSQIEAFFLQQAAQRKCIFENALGFDQPDLVDVFEALAQEANCPLLVRVGSVADGGKWVCNPWKIPKGGVVFSLGSRNDISFENELQRITGMAAAIITVDKNAVVSSTVEGLLSINATFVHAEISDTTDIDTKPPHYTVADLMRKMGHKHIEFLKIDIEGAEVSVLPHFLNSNSVCQIMVEIHKVEDTPKLLRTIANAGFLLMKYEVNPHGAAVGVSEYAFIHEKCMAKYEASLLASFLKA